MYKKTVSNQRLESNDFPIKKGEFKLSFQIGLFLQKTSLHPGLTTCRLRSNCSAAGFRSRCFFSAPFWLSGNPGTSVARSRIPFPCKKPVRLQRIRIPGCNLCTTMFCPAYLYLLIDLDLTGLALFSVDPKRQGGSVCKLIKSSLFSVSIYESIDTNRL